ncbi:hypothetical protein NFI96_024069, partial [Prochilodus magdalenae]
SELSTSYDPPRLGGWSRVLYHQAPDSGGLWHHKDLNTGSSEDPKIWTALKPFIYTMASSSTLLSEEQFQCSICLDVFIEPVSTPCGHNFCKACLSKCWNNSPTCQCPLCKEEFPRRPELRVNTFISGLVLQFKQSLQTKPNSCAKEAPSKLGYVSCDVCTDPKGNAVKSCVDCGMSFCDVHLEHHRTAAKLKKHKLIDAVKNLEDYICQKHERALERFCRDDQVCVCLFCTESDHKTHNTVPLEEESGQRKAQMKRTQALIQKVTQERIEKIEDIKLAVELKKKNADKEKAESIKVFSALVCSIKRSQAKLLEMTEERQKAAEIQAKVFIKELKQEIAELQGREAELEQLLLTEDHLHLIQNFPSTTLSSTLQTSKWAKIKINSDKSTDCLRIALFQIQQSVNMAMEKMPDISMYLSFKSVYFSYMNKFPKRFPHIGAVHLMQLEHLFLQVIPDLSIQSAEIKKLLKTRLLEGDTWYVVDSHWFRRWKKYVGFDPWDMDYVGGHNVYPGPVDNSGLLQDADSYSIKDHLFDTLDYFLLPTEGWFKLISWYGLAEGQKSIARKVIVEGMFVKHCKVEVYLTELNLWLKKQYCPVSADVSVSPQPAMASSSSLLSEEQFQCSICLDVFIEPVSTPCGHNFCKACLSKCWNNSPTCQCPLCKEVFPKRPELRVNTFISGLVLQFKQSLQTKPNSCAKEAPSKLGYVSCDVCTYPKGNAVKSCVNCGMSFCDVHLEHHRTAAKLKKHKLIDAVKNLEDYICQKHERALERFCRDDQVCVCLFCTESDHKTHNTVPLEEESGQRKAQIRKTQAHIQETIQDRMKKIKDIKHAADLQKKNADKEKADSIKVFTALISAIEKSKAEMLQMVEERQKAVEVQAKGLIQRLEKEIIELKKRETELEQLLHTEDHLQLIRVRILLSNFSSTSLSTPPLTNTWCNINFNNDWSKECLRMVLLQLQQSISKEIEKMPKINLATQKAEISQLLKTPIQKEDTWYLLDSLWFKQWKKYVGFDSWDMYHIEDQDLYPGPVDNSGILQDIDSLSIKDHLIDELDYVLVPVEGWFKLISWYGLAEGQKPIARKVVVMGMFVKHYKVEVYLTELNLCEYSDIDNVINKSFSKADTIAIIEMEMRRVFGIPDEKETRLWSKYMSNTYNLWNIPQNTVVDAGLFQGQVLVIEQRNEDGTWPGPLGTNPSP